MALLDIPDASLVDPVTTRSDPAQRALQLIEDAGLKVTPTIAASIARLHIGGRRFLVIAEDDVYPVETPMAVLGATLDCEGVLSIVCLGETS